MAILTQASTVFIKTGINLIFYPTPLAHYYLKVPSRSSKRSTLLLEIVQLPVIKTGGNPNRKGIRAQVCRLLFPGIKETLSLGSNFIKIMEFYHE